jgi:GNAT superfamily N-acetyltransferase
VLIYIIRNQTTWGFRKYLGKCFMNDISQEILNGDIFMQCDKPYTNAFRPLPKGFSTRLCKRDELTIWKTMWAQGEYMDFISEYYNKVYAPYEDDFYNRCVFVIDENDKPVASSGIWLSYRRINTILGFFVSPEYGGRGIGRGLLSEVMKNANYPIYVHTHPIASTAIKLYYDFGFRFVLDPFIGYRKNIFHDSLPYLQTILSDIQTVNASSDLIEAALLNEFAEC